jgi:hypothetical protein
MCVVGAVLLTACNQILDNRRGTLASQTDAGVADPTQPDPDEEDERENVPHVREPRTPPDGEDDDAASRDASPPRRDAGRDAGRDASRDASRDATADALVCTASEKVCSGA